MTRSRHRRSHVGLALAGAVVIAAGFAIAIVEALHYPKGSIWFVVAATFVVVGLIRFFTRAR
jgi:hypothetical protein